MKDQIGMARVGKSLGVKPFMAIRTILRGKRKGQYQITLTNGRNRSGGVVPGSKVFVSSKQLVDDGGLLNLP